DEIDAMRGESLRSVLRQLRASYPSRPSSAPWSVMLCGLRDVRDYKMASGGDPERAGTSSPFNIKDDSLMLAGFTLPQVRELYLQHTHDTGQKFTRQAITTAHELSGGQPWLVNALAREVVEKMGHQGTISSRELNRAKERLIASRQTHLDSLVARLAEPRVRRVLEPIMAGEMTSGDITYNDDLSYVADLGLVSRDPPVRVTNPIYREVMMRVLADPIQMGMALDRAWFVRGDGRLDMPRLLDGFLEFWREHGEVLGEGATYHEVAPQLVLMAWLQRIVNGGGFVEREYGVGMGRIDVLVRWPLGGRRWQREALELKVWRPKKKDPQAQGLGQLDGYLERLGLKSGTLVLFDRRPEALPIEERCSRGYAMTPGGRRVRVVRG
ncbi:MAG: ATP-binding protein, partial [Ignavibacteria bacterium]|nr:ATP-binding protein [Ignavibacteria bacterium]